MRGSVTRDQGHSRRKMLDKNKPRVAVVIATYGRPKSLSKVLESLRTQTLRPDRVVIVDATPNATIDNPPFLQTKSDLKIDYLVSGIGSLPAQKNLGIDFLKKNWDGDYVQILDDDTQPQPNFLELLSKTLKTQGDYVGVSGFFASDKPGFVTSVWEKKTGIARVKQTIFAVFGLDSRFPAIVTRGGVGTFSDLSASFADSQWLHGPAMWRYTIFDVVKYDPSLPGSALCEDLDFSLRALKHGNLATVGSARIDHEMSLDHRPDWPLHYYRFARNRMVIFRANGALDLRLAHYVLANVVVSISLLAKYLASPGDRSMLRAFCNVYKGMVDGFQNKPPK